MKYKALLLGSAAALTVTSAQAADLSIAEPVDYVRVCDAFGAGYWIIPGTDTVSCMAIGGYARFQVDTRSKNNTKHSAGWNFSASGEVSITTKSMTDYGVLSGKVVWSGTHDAYSGKAGEVSLGDVIVQLGSVSAGRFGSGFDNAGAFTYSGTDDGDTSALQVQLNWAMGGYGILIGIEDPYDRWGSSFGSFSAPDIVAAISLGSGNFDVKIGGAWHTDSTVTAYAVNAGVTIGLDSLAAGDSLVLRGDWGSSTGGPNVFLASSSAGGGTGYAYLISLLHNWSSTMNSGFTYSANNNQGASADHAYAVDLVWTGVTGMELGVQGLYTSVAGVGAWTGLLRWERDLGGG